MLQTMNVKTLKAIAIMVNVATNGKKQLLFNRICDSLEMTKVCADGFEYRHASIVGVKVPTWVILTPKVVPPVDGIDMGTGAQKGFFGPTNKENAVGGTRVNFLTSENVERPKFEQKKPKKRKAGDSDANNPGPQHQLETTAIPQTLAGSNSPPFLKQDQKISLIPNSLVHSWIGW